MGKLSPEQQRQLADLEKLRDSDDGDDETVVWVRNSDGHETRLSGARAERWLRNNGYDIDDADDSSRGEPLEAKDAKKGAPAKKAAPGKAGDPPADDDPENLPADPPAGGAKRPERRFF